jgi:hypothetical protein
LWHPSERGTTPKKLALKLFLPMGFNNYPFYKNGADAEYSREENGEPNRPIQLADTFNNGANPFPINCQNNNGKNIMRSTPHGWNLPNQNFNVGKK